MNLLTTRYVAAFASVAMTFFIVDKVEETYAVDPDYEKSAGDAPFVHPKAKYRVVMLRHGLSEANKKRVFSGWKNVELVQEGIEAAKSCGNVLKKYGYKFDIGFASLLKRSSDTLTIILDILDQSETCERRESWCLNEQHFGKNTYRPYPKPDRMNPDLDWTHNINAPPTPLPEDDEVQLQILSDKPRYLADPDFRDFPSSESLKAVNDRTIWYWESKIVPEIRAGKKVIVVTSAAPLHAIVIHLEGLPEGELVNFLQLKNATPMIYEFDENMNVVTQRLYLEIEEPKTVGDTTATSSSASTV